MRSTARGVRIREDRWAVLEDLHQAHREEYPRLSMNDFLNLLLEVGAWAWTRLPAGSQKMMLHPHKHFTRRQKERLKVQDALGKLTRDSRIDNKVSLGLPTLNKEAIRAEAARHKMKMSPYIRERLGIKLARQGVS